MISLASNVTVIPAKKTIGTQKVTDQKQKTRVAAYCRVSTDSEEQETSYDAQIQHYTSYIESHPDWVLAGIYVSNKRRRHRSLDVPDPRDGLDGQNHSQEKAWLCHQEGSPSMGTGLYQPIHGQPRHDLR